MVVENKRGARLARADTRYAAFSSASRKARRLLIKAEMMSISRFSHILLMAVFTTLERVAAPYDDEDAHAQARLFSRHRRIFNSRAQGHAGEIMIFRH